MNQSHTTYSVGHVATSCVRSGTIRRLLTLVVGVALLLLPATFAQQAFAATTGTVMATTQRMSDATLNSQQNGWYQKGSKPALTCYKRGQAVRGYYSSSFPNGLDDLWYKVSDGYFIADVDMNTGSNNPVTPACQTSGSYNLPFRNGIAMKITQNPGNPYSHNDAYNKTAVDWGAGTNTPIVASATGTVRFEGWTKGGFAPAGIMILLDHGGDNCTQYAHLSRTVIDAGQRVLKGQLIGYSGGSSNGRQGALAPHLHWAGVSCNTQQAKFVVNTQEAGTNYPINTWVTSKNNGDDLKGTGSGRCLDVAGGSTKSGTPVQLYSCNGTNSQKWLNTQASGPATPGDLRVFGSRCLDISGGNLKSGSRVQSYVCNGTNAQKWKVNANGTITTTNNLCLDAVGGGKANGTRIQVYTCNGSAAQQWR